MRTVGQINSRVSQEGADMKIPAPPGLNYLPFQEEGIRFAIEHHRALIADEMGLGKTVQAIGLCNALPQIRNILIVCPASMKLTWLREWQRWYVHENRTIAIADGAVFPPRADVVIISYDLVARYTDELHAWRWDLLICDESHKLKNDKAQRTQHLLGKWVWDPEWRCWNLPIRPVEADRILFLSGTPILNRPSELWTTARRLDPEGLGRSKSYFEEHYCDAGWNNYGWDKSGASNLEELSQRMATFTIRRTKAEVLDQLPPKRRQILLLETPSTLRALVEEEKAEYEQAVLRGVRVPFTAISKVRQRVAIAKTPFVVEHLKTLLESEQKVVVMAHHREVIDLIANAFGSDAVTVDGRSSLRYRQAMIDRFQNDSGCRLLVGGIQVAGTGINLTAANVVVFAELDWTPGVLSQAEDRVHRIGQTKKVLIQHIVLDNSLDANLIQVVTKKQRIIGAITAEVCANA